MTLTSPTQIIRFEDFEDVDKLLDQLDPDYPILWDEEDESDELCQDWDDDYYPESDDVYPLDPDEIEGLGFPLGLSKWFRTN